MLPAALVWGVTSFCSGRLSDKIDSRWLILIGSLAHAVVLVLFAGTTFQSSVTAIVGLMVLRSITRGLIQSPIVTLSMATLPDQQVRLGAGLRGLINSLGATFGSALGGIFLQQRLTLWTEFVQSNPPLAPVEQLAERWFTQQVTTSAAHDMFLLIAVTVIVTAIPVLWLRNRRAT